jgi:adenylate kinase family enzyme
MSLLLCFSGQIGSGKSSVSAAVAQALGWPRTGFGDYLRAAIARRGGDPNDRQSLQDLGQTLVDADPDAFCRDVLAAGGFTPGEDFIIDGIRHIEIFEILARISQPSDAKLLFLGAGEAVRAGRITSRTDAADFARASAHPVEAELNRALPEFANGHIDADQPLDSVLEDILKYVHLWRR